MTADPLRRTAFARHAGRLAAVAAREVVFASQVSARVEDAGARELGLPAEPNTWVALGEREAMWLGPDEWLVCSEIEPPPDVVRDLELRAGHHHRSVVDVSANRAVLELTGADRLDVLAAGCGLDLHPRWWRSGACAQTLLANAAVLLQERQASTRVFVRPSFAGHVVAWLERVASDR